MSRVQPDGLDAAGVYRNDRLNERLKSAARLRVSSIFLLSALISISVRNRLCEEV
jgi:hypothetical protein